MTYINATNKTKDELIKEMKYKNMTDNDIKVALKHIREMGEHNKTK